MHVVVSVSKKKLNIRMSIKILDTIYLFHEFQCD